MVVLKKHFGILFIALLFPMSAMGLSIFGGSGYLNITPQWSNTYDIAAIYTEDEGTVLAFYDDGTSSYETDVSISAQVLRSFENNVGLTAEAGYNLGLLKTDNGRYLIGYGLSAILDVTPYEESMLVTLGGGIHQEIFYFIDATIGFGYTFSNSPVTLLAGFDRTEAERPGYTIYEYDLNSPIWTKGSFSRPTMISSAGISVPVFSQWELNGNFTLFIFNGAPFGYATKDLFENAETGTYPTEIAHRRFGFSLGLQKRF